MRHPTINHYYYLLLSIAIPWNDVAQSFTIPAQNRIGCAYKHRRQHHHRLEQTNNNNNNDEDEEIYTLGEIPSTPPLTTTATTPQLDDLTPPAINLSRGSILFSPNPSTRRNNTFLDVWRSCKTYLPPIVTGVWPWKDGDVADDNPIGGLYNIAFVRMPVILVGLVYGRNLVEGHPLIMDIGDGPFVVNPLVVVAVLGFMLG